MTDTKITGEERASLMQKADLMGIPYKANIPSVKLKKLVTDVQDGKVPSTAKVVTSATGLNGTETVKQRQVRLRKESRKLIRCKITCLNPNRRDHPGEVMTVSNSVIGDIKKFVPFDGREFHLEQILLTMVLERKCMTYGKPTKDKPSASQHKAFINEFSVEILEPLTGEELKELADKQTLEGAAD